MKKTLYEGEELPKGYGLAWREMDRLAYVVYPIPLNIIIGYIRKLWLKIKIDEHLLKDNYQAAYSDGYWAGKKLGEDRAYEEGKKQVKDYMQALKKEINRVGLNKKKSK